MMKVSSLCCHPAAGLCSGSSVPLGESCRDGEGLWSSSSYPESLKADMAASAAAGSESFSSGCGPGLMAPHPDTRDPGSGEGRGGGKRSLFPGYLSALAAPRARYHGHVPQGAAQPEELEGAS